MTEHNGESNRFGLPVGKFLELSQKTNKRGPYQVTEQLAVQPPTRGRRLKMGDAERRILVSQAQLNIAYQLARVPVPLLPVVKEPVRATTPEGDEEAAKAADAQYESDKEAAATEYEQKLAAWKGEVQQWRKNLDGAQRSIDEHNVQVLQAEKDYDRAYFGDVYDDLIEFFDGQDEALWDAFVADIRTHWVPSQPDSDDEEAAGKDTKSSTG